mgnify:CR=1 FL=1
MMTILVNCLWSVGVIGVWETYEDIALKLTPNKLDLRFQTYF